MAFRRREKSTIECPRCSQKSLIGMESCPGCGLVFSRMEIATNKDAKRKIHRGDRDFIVYTSKLPSDVKFIKLLLFTIFLGLFGGHCFYVGRYWRAGLLLTNSIVLVLCTIFNASIVQLQEGMFIAAVATVCGLIMFVWVYDIFAVILKKFKVPVAIDLESGIDDDKVERNEEEK